MTDIAKAVAFATHCLKWQYVQVTAGSTTPTPNIHICGIGDDDESLSFSPYSAADLQRVLQEFLGTKYSFQAYRGLTSLFHWCVIVGWQDRTDKTKTTDNAQAEGEDLWDTIFDACIQAVHLYQQAA